MLYRMHLQKFSNIDLFFNSFVKIKEFNYKPFLNINKFFLAGF